MGKLVMMKAFPARLTRASYSLVPVVDPAGRVKTLKVRPGGEPQNWLKCEWQRDGAGRAVLLVSVDLTYEREQAGCLFLKEAYEAEKWPEGWAAFEDYLDRQFYVTTVEGKRLRHKPKDIGPFPTEYLPKAVQKMVAAEKPKKAEWQPKAPLVHPDDERDASFREKVDLEKARLGAELLGTGS